MKLTYAKQREFPVALHASFCESSCKETTAVEIGQSKAPCVPFFEAIRRKVPLSDWTFIIWFSKIYEGYVY